MIDFFDLFEKALNVRPHLLLEIGYTRVTDYCVIIHDSTGVGISNAKRILHFQGPDRRVVLAKAYVALNDFLCEECGGY